MKTIAKTVVLLLIILSNSSLQSQEMIINGEGKVITKEFTLSDFTQLDIAGPMNCFLVDNASQSKVVIKTHSNVMEHIEIKQENGSLRIGLKKNTKLRTFKTYEMYIPVSKKTLKKINHAGSGKVISEVVLSAKSLELNHSGSGKVVAEVRNLNLKASAAGSGKIALNGSADHIEMSLAGSGKILGEAMKSKKANVSLAGSGKVKVHANEHLEISIAGSGHVYYTGKVSDIKQSIHGSGKVTFL